MYFSLFMRRGASHGGPGDTAGAPSDEVAAATMLGRGAAEGADRARWPPEAMERGLLAASAPRLIIVETPHSRDGDIVPWVHLQYVRPRCGRHVGETVAVNHTDLLHALDDEAFGSRATNGEPW